MPMGTSTHDTDEAAIALPRYRPAGMNPTFTPVRKRTRPTKV